MEAETIVVLVLAAIFVGFVVWLAIHTRRQSRGANTAARSGGPVGQTPQAEAPQSEKTCEEKPIRG